MWGGADLADPSQDLNPMDYGWNDQNGYYIPDWFSGPTLPDYLFYEGDVDGSTEDPQNDQSDLITESDFDDASSECSWTNDSESEMET